MIAKCSCNNCGIHIEFEADGFETDTRAECPHCGLETILFIPPVAAASKLQHIRPMVWWVTSGVTLAVVIYTLFLLNNGPHHRNKTNWKIESSPLEQGTKHALQSLETIPQNLRPVAGAFGWKLGDRLPEQFRSKVRDRCFYFTPETEISPFDGFHLLLTDDGRIFAIGSHGTARNEEDFSVCKKRLISLLSEKYGMRKSRLHDSTYSTDEYEFGTENYSVNLRMTDSNLYISLDYTDKTLQTIAFGEMEAHEARIEADKKAALKKGL